MRWCCGGWAPARWVLVLVFAAPLVPKTIPHDNGMFEAAVAMLLFPAILLCGAHSAVGGIERRLCTLAGRISYPIYILHYPFLLVYMNYVLNAKPTAAASLLVGAGVFVLVVAFSWIALLMYDEPVRARLRRFAKAGAVRR